MSLRSGVALAHREIIDMVMAVKDSRVVSEMEAVSKTKVRGILALLKHGEMVTARGQEGEAIRLTLTPGIHSFRDLRDRHDAFLSRFMMEHQIFVPILVRAEVVWYLDTKEKDERLVFMERVLSLLHAYFSSTSSNRHHHHYQHHISSRKHADLSLRSYREGMGRAEIIRGGPPSTVSRNVGGTFRERSADTSPFTIAMMQTHHQQAQRVNDAFAFEEPVEAAATAYLYSPPRPRQHRAASGSAYAERTAGDEADYPAAYQHRESRAPYPQPGRSVAPPSRDVYTDGEYSSGRLSSFTEPPYADPGDVVYHQLRQQRTQPSIVDRPRLYDSSYMSDGATFLATTSERIKGSRGDHVYHNLPRRYPEDEDTTVSMASQYAQQAFTGRHHPSSPSAASLIDPFGPRAIPAGSRNTIDDHQYQHPQLYLQQYQQQLRYPPQPAGGTQQRQRGMEMSYPQHAAASASSSDRQILPQTAVPPSSGVPSLDRDILDTRSPPYRSPGHDTFGGP